MEALEHLVELSEVVAGIVFVGAKLQGPYREVVLLNGRSGFGRNVQHNVWALGQAVPAALLILHLQNSTAGQNAFLIQLSLECAVEATMKATLGGEESGVIHLMNRGLGCAYQSIPHVFVLTLRGWPFVNQLLAERGH
jgi:hypothetical protein